MNKTQKLLERVKNLLASGDVSLCKDKNNNLYAKIYVMRNMTGMEIVGSSNFIMLFKELYLQKYKEFLDSQSMQIITEILTIEGRKTTEIVNLYKRIFYEDGQYCYELEADTNKVVFIENGKIEIAELEEKCFNYSKNNANQVEPDLTVSGNNLIVLLSLHFHFKSQDDLKLFTLYLIACFFGLDNVRMPILVLYGAKGAAKSTAMRMMQKIVSPQKGDLGGQFNNLDDLQLTIADSYMVTMDNVRTIPKKYSDLLCRVCTGGSYKKRKLYSDGDMLMYDLNCILVMSSVGMPIKEPDLVDRSIVLELERIDAKKRKSEAEIWQRFNRDLPKILGNIFKILAEVLEDDEPIENTEFIRMVDFHKACIKIGRALQIKEREVNRLLACHRNYVNETLICDDLAVSCFVEIMRKHKRFVGSVTDLLNEIYRIAEVRGISYNDLPKSANHLSKRLNAVKSNLEESYNIFYAVKNTGVCREIRAELIEK